ncbi:MAG: NAD-dependent epimerase/dehydratase family protein [Gemmatimonadales bacterium]
MKVFVTGGTGLVGRHVIAALRARADGVRALARSDSAAADLRTQGAEPVRGDLGDRRGLGEAIAGSDAVLHAAAILLSGGIWDAWHAANVVGTEAVARAAARAGARMVYLSSVAVYGRRMTYDGGPASVDEDFGLDRPSYPGDFYARSKREAELALWRVAEETGLKAVALRPCVIYGEGDRNFSPRVARLVRRGLAPMIGPGNNPLSVVYAGNVAAAALAALDRRDVTGPFNVTNDGAVTQREFLERFAAGLGVPARWIPVPHALAWGGARLWDATVGALAGWTGLLSARSSVQFLASANPYTSARAERVLGWRPVVPAPEAVERTGVSFRAH